MEEKRVRVWRIMVLGVCSKNLSGVSSVWRKSML